MSTTDKIKKKKKKEEKTKDQWRHTVAAKFGPANVPAMYKCVDWLLRYSLSNETAALMRLSNQMTVSHNTCRFQLVFGTTASIPCCWS